MQHAIDSALHRRAVERLFEELDETVEDSVFEEAWAQYLEMFDVDEEGFYEILEENYLTRALLRELTVSSHMEVRLAEELVGEEADMDPAALAAFAEEEGILRAKHILLMSSEDPQADAEVLAEAEALYEELQGLSGDELYARFDEMIELYGEDPGMETNPEGYTFMPGVMVEEFFETTLATAVGEVSAPVRSGFGYHIILRLPVDPSAEVMTGGGMTMTVGQMFGAGSFGRTLEEARAQLEYTIVYDMDELDFNVIFAEPEHEEAEDDLEEDLEEIEEESEADEEE